MSKQRIIIEITSPDDSEFEVKNEDLSTLLMDVIYLFDIAEQVETDGEWDATIEMEEIK